MSGRLKLFQHGCRGQNGFGWVARIAFGRERVYLGRRAARWIVISGSQKQMARVACPSLVVLQVRGWRVNGWEDGSRSRSDSRTKSRSRDVFGKGGGRLAWWTFFVEDGPDKAAQDDHGLHSTFARASG